MPMVLSSDVPLNVSTDGDDRRPPLLLINPLGTTVAFWDPLVDELAERSWVIRFDHRGHGGSGGPVESYSVADSVADAIAVLDSLEIPKAHVLGSSFGGIVAASLAAEAPDRVDRLVLAGTSVHLGTQMWWNETIRRIEESGMAGVVDHLDKVFFSDAWQMAVPDRREAARAMLLETDPRAYVAGATTLRDADLNNIAPHIRASTLLIVGGDDPVLRHCPAGDLLRMIDDCEEVRVEGAKHRVLLEQPDLLAPVINEFLTDPDGR